MNIKKSLLCLFAAAAVLSCQKTQDVKVNASFTTDKETYEVGHRFALVANSEYLKS